jgi:tetratricopeptide (TPR) repeat protein
MRMRALIVAGFLTAAFAGTPALAVESGANVPADPPGRIAPTPDAKAAKAAHLDELFAKLKAAKEDDGRAIERQIVGEWFVSGDPETDQIMMAVMFAMQRQAFNIALRYLDKVVIDNPTYVEGWNKRATIYYYMKDYERSLADIEKTLALEPRHFGALAGLGMIMIDLGDKRKAITAFERALEVDPVLNNGAAVIEQLKAAIGKDI